MTEARRRANQMAIETTLAILRVLTAAIVAAVVFAFVAAAVNWLRTYGLPADTGVANQRLDAGKHGFAWQAIELYNTVFSGYMRFGSGIGMIAGAFWGMGNAKGKCGCARVVAGALAGFIIGARITMMITSDTHIVLGGGILSSLWTAGYLYFAGRPSRFRPLPRLNLNEQA